MHLMLARVASQFIRMILLHIQAALPFIYHAYNYILYECTWA